MKLSSREVKRMNAEKARIIIPLRKILGEQWETLNTYVTKLFEMATNREVRSAGNNTIAENNRLWKENDELKANVQRQDESLTQMAVEVDKALKTQRAAVEKGSAALSRGIKAAHRRKNCRIGRSTQRYTKQPGDSKTGGVYARRAKVIRSWWYCDGGGAMRVECCDRP